VRPSTLPARAAARAGDALHGAGGGGKGQPPAGRGRAPNRPPWARGPPAPRPPALTRPHAPAAGILDGHGGALSAQWLYDELHDAVLPLVNASLLQDGPEQPASADLGSGTGGGTAAARQLLKGVRWPAAAGAALSGVFRETDRRLVDYLRSEPPGGGGRAPPGVGGGAAGPREGARAPRAARRQSAWGQPNHGSSVAANAPRALPPLPSSIPPAAEFGVEVMGVSGSTALVALIHPTKAVFASLGDCMAVLCRKGVAFKATQQHRVYGIGPDVLEGARAAGWPWGWLLQQRRVAGAAAGPGSGSSSRRVMAGLVERQQQGRACRATPHTLLMALPTPPELARVESTGAWVIDGRVCNVLAVSRAFGDPEFKVRPKRGGPPERDVVAPAAAVARPVKPRSNAPHTPRRMQGPGLKTLLAEGARKGMWTPEFAATHEFKSDPVIVEPDVTEVTFTSDDEFLLMATDGLWDCMPPADAVSYARKQFRNGKDAQQVAEAMTSIALKRYTADNCAVIVVDLRRDKKAAGAAGGGKGGGGGGGLFGGLFGGR
jgi:serine/threonine protein phosphatase PrpC